VLKKALFIVLLIVAISYLTLSGRAPQEHVLQTKVLDEASALDCSRINPGILWSLNDSGGKAEVYALDSEGRLVCTLQLPGVKNRDWEELALYTDPKNGKNYLYVGEIGDNAAKYESVRFYKVEEPVLSKKDSLVTAGNVQSLDFVYEDGARDAEAFFVEPQTEDIYIISKREEQVGIYRISKPDFTKPVVAKRIGTLPLSWVTAADLSPDGKKVLVKTYTGVFRIKTRLNPQGELTFGKKLKALPYKLEPQGEGLCWDAKAKGYYTLSEAATDTPQILYYYK